MEALFADESCPNSLVRARISSVTDDGIVDGVSRDHFAALNAKLSKQGGWESASERWEQRVEYVCNVPRADGAGRRDLFVSYHEDDVMDVRCEAEEALGEPVFLAALTPRDETLSIEATRSRRASAEPPDPQVRPTEVAVQCFRRFTKRSATRSSSASPAKRARPSARSRSTWLPGRPSF